MARHGQEIFVKQVRLVAIVMAAALAGVALPVKAQNAASPPAQSSQKISAAQPASTQSKAQSSAAQPSSHSKLKTFSSPEEAAAALYQAARMHDEDGMLVILGPDAKDVVVWTDDPSDRKADADLFAEKYGQMHRLVKEPDEETTLYVGAENWPLPIPLVEKNGAWYFDADLGRREITFRRIGENELETVDVLHALVDAEDDFDSQIADSSGVHEYARKFNSDPGQHDGLYWPGSKNPGDSPIGPYLAQASFERSDRKPLHGYYFRILEEQGPKAAGGSRKYVVDGKMTGGFAFVAFPAEYRSSGVMTFMVDRNNVVYEKDLGPMTAQLAKNMTAFNPDSTWARVH
jgi:DUF2950 family protein